MSGTQLAVIGGGNMALAILLGAFEEDAIDPAGVVVAEPDGAKRAVFEDRGARCVDSASALASEMDAGTQLMLAVKPQVFPVVASELGDLGDRVVNSIMAGVQSETIRTALGGKVRVVRTMPNTPAQVGMGVTAITLGAGASEGDDELARSILGAVGDVVHIDENMLDAFTAVVGSGPAYVFALAEAMGNGARAVGFDAPMADRIVRGTIEGATSLLVDRGDQSPESLRQAVTSKGGTTAAALESMSGEDFFGIVERAIIAARDRGAELGKS